MEIFMAKKWEQDDTIERVCAFCEFGTPVPIVEGEEPDIICEKRGIVRADFVCRKFRYDLLKREPKDKPMLPEFVAVSLDD